MALIKIPNECGVQDNHCTYGQIGRHYPKRKDDTGAKLKLGKHRRNFLEELFHKVAAWAPKEAKSFSITRMKRNNYGRGDSFSSPYFTVTVLYYTGQKEGKYPVFKPSDVLGYRIHDDKVSEYRKNIS